MNYQQAYDKLVQAYFRDEIKPYDPKFCFCVTLNDNNERWYSTLFNTSTHHNGIHYSGEELWRMEHVFLMQLHKAGNTFSKTQPGTFYGEMINKLPNYEDILFRAFELALDELKKIHQERGEVIPEHTFQKRELVNENN